MADRTYDVVAIGNALVDVLDHVDEPTLAAWGVTKGIMQLIDVERARELYGLMDRAVALSGGSAANTAAGLALLGSQTAYIGKVRDDDLGQVFADDLHNLGVDYPTVRMATGAAPETGRSLILITPDGERSMNTYLGASEFLTPDDIDADCVTHTDWLFLEGYRFDGPDSQVAYRQAAGLCRAAGGRVALSLSDPFCIKRHREAFVDLIRTGSDMVIGNREEFKVLYEVTTLEEVKARAAQESALIVCTCSEDGVLLIEKGSISHVAAPRTAIVDATGAGDQFAAGFLHGLCAGRTLDDAARLGCSMAAATIVRVGARPDRATVAGLGTCHRAVAKEMPWAR